MTREQQKHLIQQLGNSVIASILQKIDSDEVPENWDGVELREYMALKFTQQTVKMSVKGKRDFNNVIETTNL